MEEVVQHKHAKDEAAAIVFRINFKPAGRQRRKLTFLCKMRVNKKMRACSVCWYFFLNCRETNLVIRVYNKTIYFGKFSFYSCRIHLPSTEI